MQGLQRTWWQKKGRGGLPPSRRCYGLHSEPLIVGIEVLCTNSSKLLSPSTILGTLTIRKAEGAGLPAQILHLCKTNAPAFRIARTLVIRPHGHQHQIQRTLRMIHKQIYQQSVLRCLRGNKNLSTQHQEQVLL